MGSRLATLLQFLRDTSDGLLWSAMLLDASKLQRNNPFYRIVWQGLLARRLYALVPSDKK